MNQIYNDATKCCGCGACMYICPKHAIHMESDLGGSPYPVIDTTLCIDCKRCTAVCPYHQPIAHAEVQRAFAMQNLDERQLGLSSSGGVFSALASQFLADGGVVCGAVTVSGEGLPRVMHQVIDCAEKLPLLQGSKYVQSDLTEALPVIEQALTAGKRVLFSGTPCQVAAVRNLFTKTEGQLFCVDLICHGTPGPQFFADYLDFLSKLYGGKVFEYTFRDKEKGWNKLQGHCLMRMPDGEIKHLSTSRTDSYYGLFMDGEIYRDSCYACPYAESKRVGDITIGDYWGVDQQDPGLLSVNGGSFEKSKGISCVLVNTDKGQVLLQAAVGRMRMQEVMLEHILVRNTQLKRSATHTKMRNTVLSTYATQGYEGVELAYKAYIARKTCKRAVKAILRRIKKLFSGMK